MPSIGYYKTSFKNQLTGLKMYTVRLVPYSVMDADSVVKHAVKDSNINPQDMGMGFAALSQAIEDFVLNGHSITLDGLGNFRLTCRTGKWDAKNKKWTSAGADTIDGVDNRNIRGVYVRFRPCTKLRQELNRVSFFKVDNTSTLFGRTKGGNLRLE